MLARWIDADMEDVSFLCAGINHLAYFLDFKVKGKDAYPQIKVAIEKPEIYQEEIVRNEMFKHLDYYVTESSGHNSEYSPWFRKRPELIAQYCLPGTGWNPGAYAYIRDEYLKRQNDWEQEIKDWLALEEVDISRGNEYASQIFNAYFGDGRIFQFNGNVRNFGLIDNLPPGCCVEVPVFVGKDGLHPTHVGKLPDQLAILTQASALCEELAVEGFITKDRRKIFHAILHDPLTSVVCSMAVIQDMVDEMFAQNAAYLDF